jgi:adenosylmethionine-8-amino-7-oxononanoate aminotransferase
VSGRDFDDPVAAGNELRQRCLDKGLISIILHPGNVLFLAPPLIVTEAEVDEMVSIVGSALNEMAADHT